MKLRGVLSSVLAAILLVHAICPLFILAVDADDTDVDIYRKNENEYMKIALTFDDGPHPRYTPEILDILDQYGIKATFFIVGLNAEYYPEALEEISLRGHEIGNHTYTHPHVSVLDAETLAQEVERCESVIYGLTDRRTKLFRPPEGMVDEGVKRALRGLDYKVILWDIDTRDWAHTPPEAIRDNIVKHIASGDIILMHDYVSGGSPTPEALRLFIPELLEMGYKFVVISELIGIE